MSFLHSFASRVVSNPWVYDHVQAFFGLKQMQQRLKPYFEDTVEKTVLDVGAGTGLGMRVLPPSSRYIWMDVDTEKLKGFRARHSGGQALLCDLAKVSLRDKSVDACLCVAVSHHLSDEHLPFLFSEMARVVKNKMVFLDAVEYPSYVSRLLWTLDRGSYPRVEHVLRAAMERWFDIVQLEHYAIFHHYVLYEGKPKLKQGNAQKSAPADSRRKEA